MTVADGERDIAAALVVAMDVGLLSVGGTPDHEDLSLWAVAARAGSASV
jgi:hypothetical protein